MSVLLAIAVAMVVTIPVALMTAEEAALSLLSTSRIHRLQDAERKGAEALFTLAEKEYRFRAASAVMAAFAYAVVAAVFAWAAQGLIGGAAAYVVGLVGALVGAAVVFSFGDALPRQVGVRNPEGVALTFARWTLRFTSLFYPVAKLLSALWSWGMRLVVGEKVPSPWVTEDEYRIYLPDDEDSEREQAEEALIEAVSDFAGKVVREVMVPRTDMTCLPDDADARDAIAVIEEAGYSRLPVYHDTVDDIRGVLYAKDLLAAIAKDPYARPVSIARKAFFVPETKPVRELLVEMRTRTHIAIVADEYGGTAGLVTIEDLLEEIVGEIFDEYDSEVQLVSEIGEGRFRVDARLPVDDLNELFGTAIDLDADTVGGVVTEVAGRIPDVGDAIEIEGLRMVVSESEGTRILTLIVESAGNGGKEKKDA